MPYTHIYQNSYIVAILIFVVLCIVFYLLEIGYNVEVKDGKVIKNFSWKYPLAIALVVWVIWYFYLYPPSNLKEKNSNLGNAINNARKNASNTTSSLSFLNDSNIPQKIDMTNWN